MHVLVLAGLPGTGKSALARALAARLDAPLLDKDAIRATLFGPRWIEYSREQDDWCCRVAREAVEWLAQRGRATVAVLDGRTYSRAGQADEVERWAASLGARVTWIVCRASPEVALARIAADAGRHPARDRDRALYERLARESVPLPEPRLELDTDRASPDALAERCLASLALGGRRARP